MTQGILDYLLIRSMLLLYESDFLIECVADLESFDNFITGIVNIMEKENYILTNNKFINSVSEIVNHYRFDYIKNKGINDKVNYIINKLNDYKKLSYTDRLVLTNQWLHNERIARGLPITLENFNYIYGLIQSDKTFALSMYGLENDIVPEHEWEFVEWLSLINLTMSRFPDEFEGFDVEYLMASVNHLKKVKGFCIESRLLIKKTISNLKKFKKQHSSKQKKIELK